MCRRPSSKIKVSQAIARLKSPCIGDDVDVDDDDGGDDDHSGGSNPCR